jgi:hypothetical protein
MKALQAYVVFYPAALLFAFSATWIAGRISLGYWPRPSLDDPKFIGALVDIPYTITYLLLFVGLPAFFAGASCLLYFAFRDRSRRASLLAVLALAMVLMAGSILILRSDPFRIVTWFMD